MKYFLFLSLLFSAMSNANATAQKATIDLSVEKILKLLPLNKKIKGRDGYDDYSCYITLQKIRGDYYLKVKTDSFNGYMPELNVALSMKNNNDIDVRTYSQDLDVRWPLTFIKNPNSRSDYYVKGQVEIYLESSLFDRKSARFSFYGETFEGDRLSCYVDGVLEIPSTMTF